MIEKVIINKTLKAGTNIWEEGAILSAPIPPDVLNEIYSNTGIVKVLEGEVEDGRTETKLTFVAQRVKETASTMTTMIEPTPEPIIKSKPKPKLIRR